MILYLSLLFLSIRAAILLKRNRLITTLGVNLSDPLYDSGSESAPFIVTGNATKNGLEAGDGTTWPQGLLDAKASLLGAETLENKTIINTPLIEADSFSTVPSITILDDDVHVFTPERTFGLILVGSRNINYFDVAFLAAYRASSTLFTTLISQVSNKIEATTGQLTGTTGTDGKVTISTHTDGNIYIENRYGTSISISTTLLGG